MDTDQITLGNGQVSVSQSLLDWTDAQRKLGRTTPQIVSQLHRVAELLSRDNTAKSETLYDVTVENGKYRFVYFPDGRHEAYRHGERWVAREESMTGDKALFCLVARVAELDEMLDMSARVVAEMISVPTATPPVGSASLTAAVDVTEGGIKVTALVDVPFERLTDMIVGAIEGGSAYWCETFVPDNSTVELANVKRGGIWYSESSYWLEGGKAFLEFEKPTEDHDGNATIGKQQFINGLTIMAAKAPQHFADLVNETDDATTSDVFLQCVLFGEIIFG